MWRPNLCSWTSALVPAFFVGFAVASLAGSDLVGWVAAIAVGLAAAAYQARSTKAAACPLPPSPPRTDEGVHSTRP